MQLDSRRQADIEELSPDTMRDKLAVFSTLLGAVLTFWAAVLMRDHVRLVEILTLFFGGFGAGAGVAGLVAARRGRRTAP